MKLSHSKLSCILNCPMTYYLNYIVGISKIEEKSALSIGSAVHWGIEHNTEDLTEYYNDKFSSRDDFTRDQLLAESMVHGYLKHKDEIFNELLTDESGEKLELIEEIHELKLEVPLKSYLNYEHEFVGIIDLLLITNKGLIIVDYKTSSQIPDYNVYLDQIYRYVYLCKQVFPDTPIVKIGIINIQKSKIRQKQNENNIEFLNRLKFEYEVNDEKYVNYYEFPQSNLRESDVEDYCHNLSKMADFAHTIDSTKAFFINYNAAKGPYGKSDYYELFYKVPDAYLLYKIKDTYLDDNDELINERACKPIDMKVIDDIKIVNKYDIFKDLYENYINFQKTLSDDTHSIKYQYNNFIDYLISLSYEYDEELLKTYQKVYNLSQNFNI